VLLFSPTYSTHIRQVTIASEKPVMVPTIEEKGFALDFDLTDESNSLDIAKYIIESDINSLVIIHSENPDGVKAIKDILTNAIIIPISHLKVSNKLFNTLKLYLSQLAKNNLSQIKYIMQHYSSKL